MHKPNLSEDMASARRGRRLSVEEEARQAIYRDPNNRICIPALMVKACLRQAGSEFRVLGRGKGSYKCHIMAGLRISPEYIPLRIPNGNDPEKSWEIDVRPVRIKANRVLRGRPRFNEWELEFILEVLDEQLLTEKVLKELLDFAGKYEGLGDFRPEFGLFEVVDFEQIK
jgi:hypothetical protein